MPLFSWVRYRICLGPLFPFAWWISLIPLFLALAFSQVRAEGIDLTGEWRYRNFDSETVTKSTGVVSSSQLSGLRQRYDLDFSRTLYPYLSLVGGFVLGFDDATVTSDSTEIKTGERLIVPFINLNLNNPLYRAGLGFRRTELDRDVTGIPSTGDVRDEINGFLGWSPVGLPQFNLRYNLTQTRDDPRTLDRTEKLLTFDTNYTLWKDLRLDYIYTRLDTEEAISDFRTLQQTHNGRIGYGRDFLSRRLSVNTSYNIRYDVLEFPGFGSSEIALQRFAGLFSLDDTPADGPALAVNNGLIDGNLVASAGIDIGLGGDETTLTNMGLDFGLPVGVSRIRVWVDRRLSSTVANSFSWDVYTSPDNTDTSTWTRVASISPASFGTFDNRFELNFPLVETRFIKVVTRPLLFTVPDADSFPNIFVTEMEAFTVVSGVRVQQKATTWDHNYLLNLRGKITDKTVLGYNLSYLRQDQEPSLAERSQLSNDISLNHVFNETFSAAARLARIDGEFSGRNTVTYNYGSSLRADYIPTFGQILTFSGINTEEEDSTTSNNSLFLRNNAQLYNGWSAFLDLGYTQNEREVKTDSTTIRAGTNVIPNEKITLDLNYQITSERRREGDQGRTSTTRWNIEAFFLPLRSLSLRAAFSIVDTEASKSTLQNYSLNWSPFPDGALQFFFTYTEILRPEVEGKDRQIGPNIRWAIGRHVFLDMSYFIGETESLTQRTESNNFFADLRVRF